MNCGDKSMDFLLIITNKVGYKKRLKRQMKIISRFNFLLMLLLISLNISGQTDSTIKLSFTNFLQLVKQNHPLVKQANLITKTADAITLSARGNFDPKLEFEFLSKNYKDQEYYSILNGSVKFPSILPVDPVIGVEKNSGSVCAIY